MLRVHSRYTGIRLGSLAPQCFPATTQHPEKVKLLNFEQLSNGTHQLVVVWILTTTTGENINMLSNSTLVPVGTPIIRVSYQGMNKGDTCVIEIFTNTRKEVQNAAHLCLLNCGKNVNGTYSMNEKWELSSKFQRDVLFGELNKNKESVLSTYIVHFILFVGLLCLTLATMRQYLNTSTTNKKVIITRTGKRLRGLDVIRGACTACVYLTHCNIGNYYRSGYGHIHIHIPALSSNNGPFLFPYSIVSQTKLVVFITFVLSGYVCALQYEKEKLNSKKRIKARGDEDEKKKQDDRIKSRINGNGMSQQRMAPGISSRISSRRSGSRGRSNTQRADVEVVKGSPAKATTADAFSSFSSTTGSSTAFKYIRQRLSKLLRLYFVVVLMVFIGNGTPSTKQDTFRKLGNMMSLMNQFSATYWWPSATGYIEFLPYWTMSPLVSFVCFSPLVCEWFHHEKNNSFVKLMLVVVLSSFVRMICQYVYGATNHAANGLHVYGKSSVFGLMDSFVVGVFVFYRTSMITKEKGTVDLPGVDKDCHDIGRFIFLVLGLLWWMLACTFEDFVDLQLLSRYNACIIVYLAMNCSAACLIIGVVLKNSRQSRLGNVTSCVTLCVRPFYLFFEWVGKCSLSILLVHNIAIENYFLPERNEPLTTGNMLLTRFFMAVMLTLVFALVVERLVRIVP